MKLIEDAINNFPRKRVLVIGDLILDKFSWGTIKRVNPEQPAAQLMDIEDEKYLLGGAGNVARNISSLGGQATLFCEVGQDFYKKEIEKLCESSSINLRKILSQRPNIIKQRFMAHGQQLVRADYGEKDLKKMSTEKQKETIKSLKEIIPKYDVIILSDYNKTFFVGEIAQEVINTARQFGIKTIADFKPENAKMFSGCSYLCPNRSEAEKISGVKIKSIDETNWQEVTEKIYNQIKPNAVIVTCSEEGVFAYDFIEKKPYVIPTRARKVADVTGAGDTFAAAFALGTSSCLGIKRSLELANYAAGIVVEKPGTATANKRELIDSIMQSRNL